LKLDVFNQPQREAIMHDGGPLLILAGAGSGKTRVIVHRMEYLVKKLGIAPSNILAVTFTNKAAKEMRERVKKLLGKEPPLVSTFHSFCARVLRNEISVLDYTSNFTICSDEDAERIIKDVLRDLRLNPKQYKIDSITWYIDQAKNIGLLPEEIAGGDAAREQYTAIYCEYQKKLKAANAVDFGDLLMLTAKIFMYYPDVLDRYQNRYPYLMIDEYQDTNRQQYQLVRLLSAKSRNVCVVGDDSQSIYGFRGAVIGNILEMKKDYPDLRTIMLEQNFRCTSTILKAANAVISHNQDRSEKKLWTNNQQGSLIMCVMVADEKAEGRYVASAILEERRNGSKLSNCAVLYRVNSQSRAVEEAFLKAGIPYHIVNGFRFYDRKEIKDMTCYLRFIANPNDDMALHRIVNVPARGIGDATVSRLEEYATENQVTLYAAMKAASQAGLPVPAAAKVSAFAGMMDMLIELMPIVMPSQLLIEAIKASGYLKALQEEETAAANNRVDNIKELVSVIASYEKRKETATVTGFLEHVALLSSLDDNTDKRDVVKMMSIHSSKGLEFKSVYLIGMEENIFPHERSLTNPKDISEERRLAYVAITRAMHTLHLTLAETRRMFGKVTRTKPSRFLDEIPKECLDEISWE